MHHMLSLLKAQLSDKQVEITDLRAQVKALTAQLAQANSSRAELESALARAVHEQTFTVSSPSYHAPSSSAGAGF
jgi:cell division septum initiation protein DivIVA